LSATNRKPAFQSVPLEADLCRTEINFLHNHAEVVTELALSYLGANLSGIAFYDSIIAFDKKLEDLPKSDQR
jgi:hypothetical protein